MNLSDTRNGLGQLGDGGRECFMRKNCVFLKYFEGWATKDVCFVSVFVVILMASVVSRPSEF